MKFIDFNINHSVKVKLTESGKKHYIEWHLKLNVACDCPAIDNEGYCEFQMHDLMNIFGERIIMGCPLMFNTNIKIQVP